MVRRSIGSQRSVNDIVPGAGTGPWWMSQISGGPKSSSGWNPAMENDDDEILRIMYIQEIRRRFKARALIHVVVNLKDFDRPSSYCHHTYFCHQGVMWAILSSSLKGKCFGETTGAWNLSTLCLKGTDIVADPHQPYTTSFSVKENIIRKFPIRTGFACSSSRLLSPLLSEATN